MTNIEASILCQKQILQRLANIDHMLSLLQLLADWSKIVYIDECKVPEQASTQDVFYKKKIMLGLVSPKSPFFQALLHPLILEFSNRGFRDVLKLNGRGSGWSILVPYVREKFCGREENFGLFLFNEAALGGYIYIYKSNLTQNALEKSGEGPCLF